MPRVPGLPTRFMLGQAVASGVVRHDRSASEPRRRGAIPLPLGG